ncbi:MAG TPA: hypothetical protein VJ805_01240 [Nitrospiraceae bacterium]|nr:hypothetical protein [Nitrospiraceae bacterium]
MEPLSVPEPSPFRITFFFGPETTGEDGTHWRCVFNVKKRSWKGGVQVSVDISRSQVARLVETLHLAAWTREILTCVPNDDRPALRQRIEEVFIQTLCSRKLDLALQSDFEQQNQDIPAEALTEELDHLAAREGKRIFSSLRTELDLDDPLQSDPIPQ